MRIAYLFTTFPVLSETFLQREIQAMRQLPVTIELYSIHKGDQQFEGLPVHCFCKSKLLMLFWLLPWYLLKEPVILLETLAPLFKRRPPSWINVGETLLGLAFALIHAHHFRKHKPDLFHAVWATMPASAAMLLSRLTGIPFSMGAHAYDVYRNHGDWLLPEKIRAAALIHTTTEATQKTLIARGTPSERCILIRRGLNEFPTMNPLRAFVPPLKLLAVGRLIEKKGYREQIEIYRSLRERGLAFEARIIGDGPLRKRIQQRISAYALNDCVSLLGYCEPAAVTEQLRWADVMLFTGKISPSGDRDGLPNVIPEAMAIGVPVITTPVAGAPEAIQHNRTGLIARLHDLDAWHTALCRLRDDPALRSSLRSAAREWVEKNFNAYDNAHTLAERLRSIGTQSRPNTVRHHLPRQLT